MTRTPPCRFAAVQERGCSETEYPRVRPGGNRANASTITASPMGHLEVALAEANQRGWTVVSMKDDWKRVFAFE